MSATARTLSFATALLLAAPANANDVPETRDHFVGQMIMKCIVDEEDVEPCMAENRTFLAAVLDSQAATTPRLMAMCEAEHPGDTFGVAWCWARTMHAVMAE